MIKCLRHQLVHLNINYMTLKLESSSPLVNSQPSSDTEEVAPQPSVGIVIVNWNTYDVTRECLLSLRKVTYHKATIVLVDNASSDASADRLAVEFNEVVVIKNRDNLGFAGGSNVGIERALELGSRYILLLNSDTTVDPEFLSLMVEAAENDSEIGILNPTIFNVNSVKPWYAGGNLNLWTGVPRHRQRVGRRAKRAQGTVDVSFITGCAFLIRASVVRQIGLLDEAFFLAYEDADWSIRARRAGYKAVYVPGAYIWHRESYTFRSANAKALRDYYNARNALILARKHASIYQWPSLIACHLAHLLYRACGYALLREPPRIRALYQGFRDGIKQRITRSIKYPLALRD